MKSLLVYLKKYRKESILAPLFKMLEATFELLVPLVMAAVIDTGIRNHDRHYVISMCLVLVLLGVVGLAASITAQYFAAKAATGFAGALRHALFDKIQSLTFSQMDTFGTDTLITRLTSDVNQVQNGVNLFLRLFLRSPFVVFGAMIMAFTVDARSAMLFVITIPILSVVIFGIMLTTMPLYKGVQANLDRIMTSTRENLTGVRVIRAFRKESDETRRFRENNRTLAASQKFVGRISGLMNPVTYVIINLSTCALIYVGAVRIDTGILKAGQVVALLNYMSQILIELIKLANLIIQMTKAAACGDRIAAVLAVQPDMENGEQKLSAVEDDGPAVAFRDVSLSQTVGIIGGTGSGKSSLVNLIPRFYDVSEGEVDVFGIDVRKLDAASLRDHVGIVLQKAELFKGSIADNLRWGNAEASSHDYEQALEASQAKEYVDKKPGGVGYMLEQNGRNLSGGQRQRLTIARALIKKPDILILDDSASALDFATDAKLRMAMILVLDDGKLVGKGTHEELLRSNEVYQEIYYSQFPKEAAHA